MNLRIPDQDIRNIKGTGNSDSQKMIAFPAIVSITLTGCAASVKKTDNAAPFKVGDDAFMEGRMSILQSGRLRLAVD